MKDIIVWQRQSACVGVFRGFVPPGDKPSPRMSFAENDQAHKGF